MYAARRLELDCDLFAKFECVRGVRGVRLGVFSQAVVERYAKGAG